MEKRAAVDVVGQRLATLGLGALTLDLHGGGRDGVRRLTEALRARFDLAAAAPEDAGPAPHLDDPSAEVRDRDLDRHGEIWLEAVPTRTRLAQEGLERLEAPGADPAEAGRLGALADAAAAEEPPRAPAWAWVADGATPDAVADALDRLAAILSEPPLNGEAGAGPAAAHRLAALPEEDHPAVAAARLWGPGCLDGNSPPPAPRLAAADLQVAVEAGLGSAEAASIAAEARRWAEKNRADAQRAEDPRPDGTEEECAMAFPARLRYRDAEGEETERAIDAELLFLRDDRRHFRIDRMTSLLPEGTDGWIEGPGAIAAFLQDRWGRIPAVAWQRWRAGQGAAAWTALVALARADQRLSMAERQALGRILA